MSSNIKEYYIESDSKEYLNSLNEIENVAYQIAKNHLQTSFNLQKSNGFMCFSASTSSSIHKNSFVLPSEK